MHVTGFSKIRGSHKMDMKITVFGCHRVVLQKGTIVSEKHAAPIFRIKDRRKWKLPQKLWYLPASNSLFMADLCIFFSYSLHALPYRSIFTFLIHLPPHDRFIRTTIKFTRPRLNVTPNDRYPRSSLTYRRTDTDLLKSMLSIITPHPHAKGSTANL